MAWHLLLLLFLPLLLRLLLSSLLLHFASVLAVVWTDFFTTPYDCVAHMTPMTCTHARALLLAYPFPRCVPLTCHPCEERLPRSCSACRTCSTQALGTHHQQVCSVVVWVQRFLCVV